jgi:hypothetical protein
VDTGVRDASSTAGDLDADDLPGSIALGRDWEPFADPGGHEAGFRGNGTWTRARDVDTVLLEATPIGCATAASVPSYPTPVHALEGTYRHPSSGSAVTLLVVRRSGPYVGMLIVGLPESESQPTPGQLTATMRGSMPH